MKPMLKMATVAGSVIALAFAGTTATWAQSQPGPAYLVVEVNVKDQEGFNEYAEKATETVHQHGGAFMVLGATAQTVEGAEPNGNIVIIKFGSVDQAQKWLTSPEYSAVKGIRHRTADTRQYLVEGLPAE
ncbi:DUF1330 domain-containing protein [Chelativorans salis]|uniref:DUF1330 domain-containing protein n=1 Tax=Chelativorans salis TaxID=2978478 RepID=A0ABT2LSH2_9HYPH|nr:DUF1330 domain-containing protein [Chelativorans sp. EGI FJ00035]MCT7377465.1 DUF1330 domain-containing protein [Chelativorans sp. EGI FJ00035]